MLEIGNYEGNSGGNCLELGERTFYPLRISTKKKGDRFVRSPCET